MKQKLAYTLASVLSLSLFSSPLFATLGATEYREIVNAKVTVSASFNCLETPSQTNRVNPLYTGLNVDAGDLLIFNVDPNQLWSSGFHTDSNQNITKVFTGNANGSGNPFGADWGQGLTIQSHSFLVGSLVGSLDDGNSFFLVGTDLAMFAPQAGHLSLYHWDSGCSDNSSSLDVSISIRK